MNLSPVIILVDDSDSDRLLYCKYMTQAGRESISFESGEAFISKVTGLPPSLVLLDIEMPGMNGFETIKQLKEMQNGALQRHIVVAVTSHSGNEIMDQIARGGFDDWLQKPFMRNDLERLISKYVKTPASGSFPGKANSNSSKCGDKLYSLEMFDGQEPEFVKSIIGMFIKNTPASIEIMQTALQKNDLEMLRQTAHKLKPHFSFFHIFDVQQALQQVETIAANGKPDESLAGLISCVSERSLSVIEQMKIDSLL